MIGLLNDNFDNSPKRQIFLELALKQYCPNTHHAKLKYFCKTCCVGTWKTLLFGKFCELYEHGVTCLDAMVNPHVSPEVNESRWNWDSDTKTTTHGLKSSLQSL